MKPLPDHEHPLVFFTGGTALRRLSSSLAARTPHTVHVVTPFDSGGSTAALRGAFAMPAIGDMRNRLLALADESRVGTKLVRALDLRLPDTGSPEALRDGLRRMGEDDHRLWQDISGNARDVLLPFLRTFLSSMPADFDARNASLGNLFMAGCYLKEGRSLYSVLAIFSRLLKARGQILPVVEESLHLAAHLADGTNLVGQHRFKELRTPVDTLFLTVHEPREGVSASTACRPLAASPALARIRTASLICYPMGSFYTSVVANLLPAGIGRAIAHRKCPKVYLPNTGQDCEITGLTLKDEVSIILRTLEKDVPGSRPSDFISCVCVDTVNGIYPADDMNEVASWLGEQDIAFKDCRIVFPDGVWHDPERTADLLMGMCGGEKQDD